MRPKNSNIRKYFIYDISTNKSICQCGIQITNLLEPEINNDDEVEDDPEEPRTSSSSSTSNKQKKECYRT